MTPAGISYRGVVANHGSSVKPWQAFITVRRGDRRYLGSFADPEEAARVADSAARKYFLNPVCNFREDGTLNPDRHRRNRNIVRPEFRKEVEAFRQRLNAKKGRATTVSTARDTAVSQAQSASSDIYDRESDSDVESDEDEDEEEEGEVMEEENEEGEDEEEGEKDKEMVVVAEEGDEEESDEQQPQQRQQQEREEGGQQPCYTSSASPAPAATRSGDDARRSGSDSSGSCVGRAAGMDVWVELKTAVFRKLMSLDGPALSEEQERNYMGLIELLNKPTPSLRGYVVDVVVRSGFNAEVVDRAAGLLADMAAHGGFDE